MYIGRFGPLLAGKPGHLLDQRRRSSNNRRRRRPARGCGLR
jgi:hypothetical protein